MNSSPENLRSDSTARRTLVAFIIALAAATVAFRLLVMANLNHTALVFMGIPALLALALVGVQPKTSAGTMHKTIAIALCMSGIVFGEAFICIVMASPIFFCIGALAERVTRWQGKRTLGLILIPLSLEGVIPAVEFPREETVTVERVVAASPQAVRATLAGPMRFDETLPAFFRIGFPTPGATAGQGLGIGDQRSIQFIHGHHPGTLVLQVTRSSTHEVVFEAVSDDSYITHWLTWRSAEVRLQEIGDGTTLVSWTLRYRRRLDPAWYFKPLERYGVRLAGAYLLTTLSTPRREGE